RAGSGGGLRLARRSLFPVALGVLLLPPPLLVLQPRTIRPALAKRRESVARADPRRDLPHHRVLAILGVLDLLRTGASEQVLGAVPAFFIGLFRARDLVPDLHQIDLLRLDAVVGHAPVAADVARVPFAIPLAVA